MRPTPQSVVLKFGLLTDPIESVPAEIRLFKRLDFDYAEIGIEEPRATPQILMGESQEILKALSETGLFPIGHTAYWVGFGSSHESVRRGWVEEGKEMIRTAAQLKIRFLNFHYNARLGRVGAKEESRETFVQNFVNSMRELAGVASLMQIELMLENSPPQGLYPLEGIEYFERVLDAVPSLKFHFDVAHAFIENRMKGVQQYLDAFADRLVHVHMHDNHGKQDEHLALGGGKIDFRKVIRALKAVDYNRTITFEVFTSRTDAARSRDAFKKRWERACK
ncbi:MAG TPA: sugar phosphate isomerase/epimerase family protein [Terriglobales bacterium]|nr:sugar phosphate isomerase/epimerase family protein [Terriglobales bacterium]